MSNVEIIRNLPFVDYVQIDRMNISSLCWLLTSAKNYQHCKAAPIDTAATRLGHVAHTSILEPDLYDDSVVVWPHDKKAKGWKAFKEEHEGDVRALLSQAEDDAARNIAKAVRGHSMATALLDGGDKEITVLWTHERTGLKLKARLDHLDIDKRALVDLKTTGAGISPRKFAKTSFDFHYDIKMAFYAEAARQVCGEPVAVGLVVVEVKPPHDVQCFGVERPMLDAGTIGYEHLIDRLIYCRENDYWPGVAENSVAPLTFTPYQTRDYSALMARELDNE